jgi:hypothetical protein
VDELYHCEEIVESQMDGQNNGSDRSQDKYARYWQELDKEDKLVNDRVNWLLLSQSILFAAIGFAGKGDGGSIATVVPWAGFFLSAFIWVSVAAAVSSGLRFRKLMDKNCPQDAYPDGAYPQVRRPRWNVGFGHIAPIFMPSVFVGAWVWLIVT